MITLRNKSKDEVMEFCYNLCVESEWNSEKFFNKTDLTQDEVKKYAKEYMFKVLKTSLNQEQAWFLMPLKIKKLFNNYDDVISLLVKSKNISYQNLMDNDWLSQNLRKFIGKYCYGICENLNWGYENVKKYCDENNVNFNYVKKFAREYMDDVLNLSKAEKFEKWGKISEYHSQRVSEVMHKKMKENPSEYAKIYDSILSASSDQQIIEIINNCSGGFSYLKTKFSDYLMFYCDDSNNVESELRKRINVYLNYLNEQKNKQQTTDMENNLKTAKQIVTQYLDGNYEKIQDFLEEKQIYKQQFDRHVNLIKEKDKELYDRYIKNSENMRKARYTILVSEINEIVELIKNGVVEDGVKREFNLIDYYLHTNLNFDELLRIIKDKLDVETYKALRTFIAQNRYDRKLSVEDIKNLYNTKTVVGIQFDDKGNIIPGSGREITKGEKENIIEYLKLNDIPVTKKTYSIIYKRWLDGNLVIDNQKNNNTK